METTLQNKNKSQPASLRAIALPLLLIASAYALAGCGATTKARSGGIGGSGATMNSTTSSAECNSFDSRDLKLSGKVTSYYYNGVLQEDRVRLRISGIANQFETSTATHIKFFRWRLDASGKVDLDSNPLTFLIEKGSNNSTPISGTMNSFNLTDLNKLRAQGSVGGTTTQSFFDNTLFTVTGTNYDWHALKIVLYDGTTTLGQADMLLPIFHANPNTYATTHATVLNQMHPFWGQRNQSATDADWAIRSESFCF